ncbi:hypothetical protein ACFFX0_28810 [Citricoccus parietis]|uniref:Uncharacterized protein n=1 Tax=Citricoccus parietis TaxID=592307 RepID=A0ABV5G5R2_9MICC
MSERSTAARPSSSGSVVTPDSIGDRRAAARLRPASVTRATPGTMRVNNREHNVKKD